MHAAHEPVTGHRVRVSLSRRSIVLASMVLLNAARDSCMLCEMPVFAVRASPT